MLIILNYGSDNKCVHLCENRLVCSTDLFGHFQIYAFYIFTALNTQFISSSPSLFYIVAARGGLFVIWSSQAQKLRLLAIFKGQPIRRHFA